MKNFLFYIICGSMAIGGLACASLSEYVTPARISPKAIEYVEEANVVEPNAFNGYPNLDKANRLAQAVVAAYEVNSLALSQLQEKNNLDYSLLNDIVIKNRQEAQAREEELFSQTGYLSMGLSLAGFGGLGGLLGLMRKRPGDLTQQDYELAVNSINGEVQKRDNQLIEVVKGVQDFINEHKDDQLVADLKGMLEKRQSEGTKQTVGKIKATI